MRTNNPVLSRQDAFTPAPQYSPQQQYGGPGTEPQGYGPDVQQGQTTPPQQSGGLMTFEDVVTKTALMIGLVIVAAAAAWLLVPESLTWIGLIGSGLVGFVCAILVAVRRKISPPLMFLYAAVEGIFVGLLSRLFEGFYDGIVMQAVFATLVAAGVTLAAYKFFNIRVTAKFKKIVIIATVAFAAAMLINFGLSFVGINLGLRAGVTGPVSPLAIGISALAVVLAVFNLIMDFDHVERGIAMRAPAEQSWVAAFGLTVTLVWLYVELLRIISYFRR
ncbi:MAG: Bax inhibitor-1/YccA family protein [Propionibacteriales bacterium]|nr:Bax inhibitor-1/YccA family protein [Propionibacteriales bacterium]